MKPLISDPPQQKYCILIEKIDEKIGYIAQYYTQVVIPYQPTFEADPSLKQQHFYLRSVGGLAITGRLELWFGRIRQPIRSKNGKILYNITINIICLFS